MVIPIREEQQRRREDVVHEHLSIILALLLNIDDQNLLDVKRPLE